METKREREAKHGALWSNLTIFLVAPKENAQRFKPRVPPTYHGPHPSQITWF